MPPRRHRLKLPTAKIKKIKKIFKSSRFTPREASNKATTTNQAATTKLQQQVQQREQVKGRSIA
jgi:hypothetical protein